jgi:DNA-binding beta-propeller fold protein YncE
MVQQTGLSVLPIFSAGKPEMKEISGDCGSTVLVTPEWTPDGKLIIYTVYGNGRGAMGKVCVINPETANVSQVQAGGSVEGSAVDPGSRFLYLAVMNPDYDNQGIDPDWRLLRYDLQNHSLELLASLIYGGQNLSLSPGGKRMIFSERDGQILTIIEVGTWKKTPIALDGRLTSVCGWLDNDHLLLSQAKRDNIQSRILFSFDIANGQMLQISGYHEMQACRVQILNNWP